jgi:hypothetical protein
MRSGLASELRHSKTCKHRPITHAGPHPHPYFLGILTSMLSYIAVIYSLKSISIFFFFLCKSWFQICLSTFWGRLVWEYGCGCFSKCFSCWNASKWCFFIFLKLFLRSTYQNNPKYIKILNYFKKKLNFF